MANMNPMTNMNPMANINNFNSISNNINAMNEKANMKEMIVIDDIQGNHLMPIIADMQEEIEINKIEENMNKE